MALSELQRAQVSRRLSDYCESRVPLRVRDQVRLSFRLAPHHVELFEERPRYDAPEIWMEHSIAKFRYVASRREWWLYCIRRDLRWHRYEPFPLARDFDKLLDEVDEDPTGIFWG